MLKKRAFLGERCRNDMEGLQRGNLLGKVAENGAFFGEIVLKMGQNALKKGHFLGKDAEMTQKGSKVGIYWGK